jgi:formylglycine-generating enzyme required for sulfatase activity
VRQRSQRATIGGLLAALACLLAGDRALTQDSPGARASATFETYVEKIPGTDVSFTMVPIPGGTFSIGSPPGEPKRSADEGPQHEIIIPPFWMEEHEVTWAEFDQFGFSREIKGRTPDYMPTVADKVADAVTRPTRPYADETHGHGRKGQPVICITHHAAMEYCRWLSAKTGLDYRLPTEAEWEYACRAGSKTAYSFGDDPKELEAYAWYVENAEKPQPIKKKKPNRWGLFDMHGNVAEWCLDHYAADTYAKYPPGPVRAPVVLPTAKEYPYVARGGSWDDDPDRLRSAARRSSELEWSVRDPQRPQSIWWHTDATFVGFRVVRPLQEQENLRGFKSPVVSKKTAK